MATTTSVTSAPTTIVSGAASPVSLSIEPTLSAVTLTITSGAAITITGQVGTDGNRRVDVSHQP